MSLACILVCLSGVDVVNEEEMPRVPAPKSPAPWNTLLKGAVSRPRLQFIHMSHNVVVQHRGGEAGLQGDLREGVLSVDKVLEIFTSMLQDNAPC